MIKVASYYREAHKPSGKDNHYRSRYTSTDPDRESDEFQKDTQHVEDPGRSAIRTANGALGERGKTQYVLWDPGNRAREATTWSL